MESGFLLLTKSSYFDNSFSKPPCFNGIRVLTSYTCPYQSYPPRLRELVLMESGFLLLTRLNIWYSICNYYSTCFYYLILQKVYYIYTFSCIFASFPHRFSLLYSFYINGLNFIHFCFSKKYPRQFLI